MTTDQNSVQPIPEGYHTITPWFMVKDSAQLIEFMVKAFDATEMGRVYNPDGKIGHAEVRIGDSVVMMFDANEGWPDIPTLIRLYVEDGDAVFQKALDAGAAVVTEMTELGFGDRGGRVRDPFGNIWWIQTHVEDVAPEEMVKRAGEKKYMEAMQYFQDSYNHEMRRRIIGSSGSR
jgi:PhnB protein